MSPDHGRELMQVLRADSRVDAEQLLGNIMAVAVLGADTAMDVEVVTTGNNEMYIVLTATIDSSHDVRHRQRVLDQMASAIADKPDEFALNWASVLKPMR